MKILITGATGFIGSNLINALKSEPYEILAVKRSKDSKPRIALKNTNIEWIVKQLQEFSTADLKGIEAIIHLASHSTNFPYDNLQNCVQENVINHSLFIQKAIAADIKHFIIAGSCFEYGLSGLDFDFIPVTAKLKPIGTYATSKAMSFMAFQEIFRGTNCTVRYERLFHVFGEGELESRLWPTLKHHAEQGIDIDLTLGEQIRDFIHVQEVANHFLLRINEILDKSNKSNFLVSNVGTGNPQSIREFCEYWWRKWNAKGKLNFGAIPYREKEIFRFVPQIEKYKMNET